MLLDEDTRMIQETVAKFVDRELIPIESDVLKAKVSGDAGYGLSEAHNDRLRKVSKELGLWGLDAPVELGGQDLPAVTIAAVKEEMGRSCVNFTLPPDSPNLRMLNAVGTEAQKQRYLKPYIEGKMVSAIAISEPGAGGDPAGLRTRAVLEGGQWVINGRKIWISNAKNADFIIVMARVGEGQRRGGITSFIVDGNMKGISYKVIPVIRAYAPYEVHFDNVEVPVENRLGEEGGGFKLAEKWLVEGRVPYAAGTLGIAQASLELAIDWAKQREAFGSRLSEKQAIQWMLADSEMELRAARLLTWAAAWKADLGQDLKLDASIAKVTATETAGRVVDRCIQIFGGLGVSKELPLERWYRELRIKRIGEGPSEVQRMVVARNLLGNRG